ncbi:FAD-binding oxidoreductase [Ancylobacter sp. A5.8]|uniref:NAD(P)/FAD-dependent oxidoreductase n=1 Tax=Ancylobacter gelatini TaxID=2919920 RepID=UPI001F4E1915|nr:FAD-binding oxidoreductase [Ancylobacter gelatini]MCJ8143924.1 FAD-binding oxidoreductase [Ancylobacter gelatini]
MAASTPCGLIASADIIVLGGGIAGAGAAFEMAGSRTVVLLEREASCGFHATGRSAASFTENYGSAIVRRLALGSRDFLSAPPAGFCDHDILLPRGMITIARADQMDRLAAELERGRALVPSMSRISTEEARRRVPVLREDYLAGAFIEPNSMEVDVHGLHQGFLRGARRRGARIEVNAAVTALERIGGAWRVETAAGAYVAPVVVNAAGAWADEIAGMAGVRPLGLAPLRRTAFNIPAPEGIDIRAWPLVNDVGDEFYFKNDAGQLFVSPSDATPSAPMDAYADDMDVAIGVERLERATTLRVRRVSHSWAGLRTFAPDGSPVAGFDPAAEGFFWLAGQGGYGVKTSPALSRLAASLLRSEGVPDDLARLGLTENDLAPTRFDAPATH